MFPGRFSSLNASVLWKSQYNLHWNADFFVSRKKTLRRERKKKIIHNLNSRQQTLILLFVLTFASVFSKVILTKNIPRRTVHYHKVKKNGWSLCQRGVAFGKNLWEGQAKKSLFQPVLSKCHRVRNFENLIFDKDNLWTRIFWA